MQQHFDDTEIDIRFFGSFKSLSCLKPNVVHKSKNVSADCRDSSLNETWQKIKTSPDLPVTHGTEISLSCETGYTLAGSHTATCNNGIIQPASLPPQCLGMISLISGEIPAFPA